MKLPQEIIEDIIDNLSSSLDLKSCSLVGRAWTRTSQKRFLHHIVLAPDDVKLWLSRSEKTTATMAPWITKFELRAHKRSEPGTMPWDEPPILTRLIGSLALSPIRHLTITPFHMGRFQKFPLVRCFGPIANSLRSLELRFLKTCTPALTFLISMFPNLDDIYLEFIKTTPMKWAREGYNPGHIPSFAGTFEYLDLYDGTRLPFLSWIMGFPLRFHTISPGMLAHHDVPVFSKLVTMCAPTLREIPHIMFDKDVGPDHLDGILNPCTNLRRIGVCGGEFARLWSVAETTLRSLRSRHISVIYLEIVETLRTLQVGHVWSNGGWQQFEDFLCELADERIDDGEPLVLELGIWRNPRLKAYGPLDPGAMLPRFRERSLIRFSTPPEDPDYAAALEVKYTSPDPVAAGIMVALAGLLAGG